MGQFQRSCLQVLDRIYRFTGAVKSSSVLDLQAPIQLVHDTSREAELEGYGIDRGLSVMATWGVNHAGASTERYVIDPYFAVAATYPIDPNIDLKPDEFDLWLLSFAVVSSAATQPATRFDFGYVINGDLPPYSSQSVPAVFFHGHAGASDVTYISNYAGTGNVYVLGEDLTVVQPPKASLPFRFPHRGRVGIVSVSTGACDVFVNCLLWVGPRGCTPPGMR